MKHIKTTTKIQPIRLELARTVNPQAKLDNLVCVVAPDKEKCEF